MTKDEFAAIKGREKVATKGPWNAVIMSTSSANCWPTIYQQHPVANARPHDGFGKRR